MAWHRETSMGLDAAAFQGVHHVCEEDDGSEYDRLASIGKKVFWVSPVHEGVDHNRLWGALPGLYWAKTRLDHRIGSYSGYGEWREQLARLMLDTSCEELWACPEAFSDPFVYLLNFSDCEGAFGPECCKVLTKHFKKNESIFIARVQLSGLEEPEGYIEVYRCFRELFEFATKRGDGFVIFT